MVLAAGMGSRLKPYTIRTPKPLIPLLGVPCIEYSLLQLRTMSLKKIVVNVHAHADQLKKYLGSYSTVSISDESEKLLGSAGGFRKALPLLEEGNGGSEPFFSMNADVVSLIDLRKLEARHRELRKKHGVVMTLCLAHGKTLQEQEGSYTEILVNEAEGLITGIGEKKNRVPFYTGTAVFETEAFRHLKDGEPAEFSPEVLIPWICQNKVGFFKMDECWVDVGSPELWKKSHFVLMNAFSREKTPAVWADAVDQGMKKGFFSEEKNVVDYDHREFTGDTGYLLYQGDRLDV